MESMGKTDGSSGSVKSLVRALRILRSFTKEVPYRSMTSIAQETGLPFSTTTRLVNTLVEEGFLLKKEDSKLFHPGYLLAFLGEVANETMDLKKTALPVMEDLRTRFRETVNIFVRSENKRICYAQLESPQQLKHSARLGDAYPLWAGAAGKCFLAFGSSEDLEEALVEIEPLTGSTVTDREIFVSQLEEVRTDGYLITSEERARGVTSAAAPIFDAQGKMAAVITVAGPTLQFTSDLLEELVPALLNAARTISRKLGAPTF